jgi:hypothetical protein
LGRLPFTTGEVKKMTKRRLYRFFAWAGLVFAGALLAACGGGGGAPAGTLQVGLTDAASPQFNSVVVSVKAVEVVPASAAADSQAGLPVIATFEQPKEINVLDLKFQQQLLGTASIPAGDYSQVRLVLAANTDPANPANYLTLASDPNTRIPIDTPSGQESGLKVTGNFTVAAGQSTALVLDFDPARAIVQAGASGNWNFKPTGIRLVETKDILANYGALSGQIVQETTDSSGQKVQAPVLDATVSVTEDGSGALAAVTAVDPEDGTFRVQLPAGSYDIQVQAPGFAPFTSAPPPFQVQVGAETDAGTLQLTAPLN